jgi:hypothetical protein
VTVAELSHLIGLEAADGNPNAASFQNAIMALHAQPATNQSEVTS